MRNYRSVHVVCAMEMPMQFNMYRFIICNGNAANAQCRYPCLCVLVCKRNVMSWFRIVSSFCKYCTFVFHCTKLYWNANFVCLQWNLHFFSEIHSVLLFVQSVVCFFSLCLCPGRYPRRPDGGRFSFAHGAGRAQWKRGVSKTAFEPGDADSTRIPYVAVYRWVSLTDVSSLRRN